MVNMRALGARESGFESQCSDFTKASSDKSDFESGSSSMAEHLPSKQGTRVRFSSPALDFLLVLC